MSAIGNKQLLPGQFYGNVVNKRRCSGLVLSELKHTSPKKLVEHSHQLANFCLLLVVGIENILDRVSFATTSRSS